jgi:arginase
MDLGADRRGVDMGPSALRCAYLQRRLEQLGYVVRDHGDIPVRRPANNGGILDANLKYVDEIARVNRELCRSVKGAMSGGDFPLVLGGDHSIAIGTIAGVLAHCPKLGVIWYDSHGDVNTAETTPSGNIHGMSLAVALGYGHPKLTGIGGRRTAVRPQNVAVIGARALDSGERQFLKDKGVHVFTMHQIDRLGMPRVMEDALSVVTHQTDGVHLSLDLDSLDPLVAPGVGTPVPGGLTYRESHLAMEMISEANILVSAEITEVNPTLDRRNQTAKVAVDLMGSLFGECIL